MPLHKRWYNYKYCLSLLSSTLLLLRPIHGFVPPHPASELSEQWESVHQWRRRMQQPFHYTPQFVHPELCRYMNETECQDVDLTLQDHAKRHRSLLSTSTTPKDDNDFEDHNGLTHQYTTRARNGNLRSAPPKRNPHSIGPDEPVIEVLVILMRFQDHVNRTLPTKRTLENLWNDRIHQWFDLNSYGHYRYHATVTDWMDTDDTEESYAGGVSGLRHSLQHSFWPLLDTLHETKDWDWAQFDRNQDGKLDAVVILHSGYPAELGGWDCTNQRPVKDRIWSHAFASSFSWTTQGIMGPAEFNDTYWEQQLHSQQQPQPMAASASSAAAAPPVDEAPIYGLHGYLVASALDGNCGAEPAKMGVAVHEYMHTLGLDDVYDYAVDSPGKGIGIWDLMAYPFGPENDEDFPGHLSAYSKVSLGWLTPTEWNREQGDTTITLEPAEISNGAIKISLTNVTALPSDVVTRLMPQYQNHNRQYEEYLLIEFRQALEFDRDLNDKVGLVVYHVDEAVPRMNNRGYPQQDGWPRNGNHYRVSVLAADGLYHLERGINKGDPSDTWKPGVVLGPGSDTAFTHITAKTFAGGKEEETQGRSSSGDDGDDTDSRQGGVTYPNTDTYQFGIVRETGIHIENVNESPRAVTVKLSWKPSVVETEQQPTGFEADSSCRNMWDWVDLEVELPDGQLTVESLHCSIVAEDTDYYCSKHDFSWGWQVWEICRSECPNSDCYVIMP
ncbi:Immune inhibitor A peptidase M6 [Seminavis robusta]|uniref:Immune inhibitor A peptidase M6 n=1 Tax=Seminavis robusta TaxID=568900 RepID=A0A9N8EVI1_9STRA|nr:Immune inhibitor A peptidase M6 [Seminavis robusta]|eukprot:Sro1685_g291060.1 Immune inhibitor A peptidase M6 (726) ;mRNA; r:10921-13379